MKEFSTALLREKFVIAPPKSGAKTDQSAVIALSNRLVVPLYDNKGKLSEKLVVRAQNMHTVVRMAARILQAFSHTGPVTGKTNPFNWETAWQGVVSEYEYTYNAARWIAIYHLGKCIFSAGEHHPLLDMIEKCDADNNKDYDFAVPLAENLFVQAGKPYKITHDSNVALSVHFEDQQARCGIILRSPTRKTTFTFTAYPKETKDLNIPQCLGACAAFLEGVQLAFLMGMNTEKIKIGLIERFSKEEKQTREGKKRLNRLADEITVLEKAFRVSYRPEKPDFYHIMMDAEKLGQETLVPPEKPEAPAEDGKSP